MYWKDFYGPKTSSLVFLQVFLNLLKQYLGPSNLILSFRTPVFQTYQLQKEMREIINMIFSGDSTRRDSLTKKKTHSRYVSTISLGKVQKHH